MTTLWAESFTEFTGAVFGEYAAAQGFACDITSGRRTGGGAFVTVSTGGGTFMRRTLGVSSGTMFQSVAFKPLAVSAIRELLVFMEGATTHVIVAMDATGHVAAYRGTTGTLLGTSSAIVWAAGIFQWIQAKVVISDTVGSVEVRDGNGNVLLNLTNQDTRNAATGVCDTASCGHTTNMGSGYIFCDWHVWDSTGSICNNFTNDTRVDTRFPVGAGDLTDFTPSAGANWTTVDERPPNTTDYVSSTVAGNQDLYDFDNITHTPVSIFSVLRVNVSQKDDAGVRSLKPLTKSGGTVYAGTAVALTQGSYVRNVDVQETNPNTSAAWTKTNLNAAQFGEENV